MIKALIFLLSCFVGQAPQPAVPAAVPVGSEGHHHLKLENEYVRVFDVLVPSGDATLYHIHSNDYAYVSLSNVGLRAQILGGQPIDLVLRNGEVRYTRGPITHMVSNPDTNPFRNITVEVLKPGPRSTGSALGIPSTLGTPSRSDRVQAAELPRLPNHTVELENDRVRILRVVLEPGQSTGLHTHVPPNLHVAVTAAKVVCDSPGTNAETKDSKPGDFTWSPSRTAQDLKNAGAARFEAIEIEFK